MRRFLLVPLLLLPALAIAQVPAGIVTTREPVSPSGVRAVCDLPASQHLMNRGGNDRTRDNPRGEPGKGSGLCVFTAVEIASRWQWVQSLHGFQEWMTHQPGGGYPDKLDRMIAAYCRERRATVPAYVQHTGGDDAFLDLAVKTGRLPCVTYAGMDGFYRDAWGRDVWVDHMLNLAHLDAANAAVIDNNRPGVWVWMTRKDFLVRWRARGGGWAVVLLDPGPPPHVPGSGFSAEQCGPNGCPLPLRNRQSDPGGAWIPNENGVEWGYWQGGRCLARCFADGRCEAVDANGQATGEAITPPAALPTAITARTLAPNYGIEKERVYQRATYSISGVEVTREAAHAALAGGSLVDDSDRWHLTAVGEAAFLARFRSDVTALPATTLAKLHVHAYAPSDWPIALYRLPNGVCLRKPSATRTAEQTGDVSTADYTSAKLRELLAPVNGSEPAPPPKSPADPVPVSPSPPASPVVAAPDRSGLLALVVAAATLVLGVLRRRS